MYARMLIVTVGMIMTVPALAEPGPMQGACRADIKALCAAVQPGAGRLRDCMREHRTELSAACKIAIADRMLARGEHRSATTARVVSVPAAGKSGE